jgi:hypothetical protein
LLVVNDDVVCCQDILSGVVSDNVINIFGRVGGNIYCAFSPHDSNDVYFLHCCTICVEVVTNVLIDFRSDSFRIDVSYVVLKI